MHLEDEVGAASARSGAGAVDVERVRRGRDHHVGPEVVREGAAACPQITREGDDVGRAANAVAVVARQPQPFELDPIDDLAADPVRELGVARTHV